MREGPTTYVLVDLDCDGTAAGDVATCSGRDDGRLLGKGGEREGGEDEDALHDASFGAGCITDRRVAAHAFIVPRRLAYSVRNACSGDVHCMSTGVRGTAPGIRTSLTDPTGLAATKICNDRSHSLEARCARHPSPGGSNDGRESRVEYAGFCTRQFCVRFAGAVDVLVGPANVNSGADVSGIGVCVSALLGGGEPEGVKALITGIL